VSSTLSQSKAAYSVSFLRKWQEDWVSFPYLSPQGAAQDHTKEHSTAMEEHLVPISTDPLMRLSKSLNLGKLQLSHQWSKEGWSRLSSDILNVSLGVVAMLCFCFKWERPHRHINLLPFPPKRNWNTPNWSHSYCCKKHGSAGVSNWLISHPLDIYSVEELLDHMAVLFLMLWRASILFSIVAILIYIPTNNV
jgi:hypothetical protein